MARPCATSTRSASDNAFGTLSDSTVKPYSTRSARSSRSEHSPCRRSTARHQRRRTVPRRAGACSTSGGNGQPSGAGGRATRRVGNRGQSALVQVDRLGRRGPAPRHPLGQLAIEPVEHVDERLPALVELPALEGAEPGVDAHLSVGVVAQPAWRRGQRSVRSGVGHEGLRCDAEVHRVPQERGAAPSPATRMAEGCHRVGRQQAARAAPTPPASDEEPHPAPRTSRPTAPPPNPPTPGPHSPGPPLPRPRQPPLLPAPCGAESVPNRRRRASQTERGGRGWAGADGGVRARAAVAGTAAGRRVGSPAGSGADRPAGSGCARRGAVTVRLFGGVGQGFGE